MKAGQIWSVEYDCYVSHTFMPKKEKSIKLDITNCIIKLSPFGFYELWMNDKYIKPISFNQYLYYKKFVKKVIKMEVYS